MLDRISRRALIGAGLSLAATPAFALDAEDFAAKVEAIGALMGYGLSVGSATAEGDAITLSDFTFNAPGYQETVEWSGNLVFEGVIETPDGGYTAEAARTADIDIASDADDEVQAQVVVRNMLIEGIHIPADITPDLTGFINYSLYERASVGPITIDIEGKGRLTLEHMEAAFDTRSDPNVMTGSVSMTGFSMPLDQFSVPEAEEMMSTLGIDTFRGDFFTDMTWDMNTGLVSVDNFVFDLVDLGSFSVSGTVTGYTEAFYQDLMKINRKRSEFFAQGSGEYTVAEYQAFDMAVLAKMTELKLERATIRYDDHSLFLKALELAAAEQGIDSATLKSGLRFTAPMLLAELDNPAFAEMVTSAFNTFINDPQSVELTVAPAQPVGFGEISAASAEAAGPLIDLLNPTITANQ